MMEPWISILFTLMQHAYDTTVYQCRKQHEVIQKTTVLGVGTGIITVYCFSVLKGLIYIQFSPDISHKRDRITVSNIFLRIIKGFENSPANVTSTNSSFKHSQLTGALILLNCNIRNNNILKAVPQRKHWIAFQTEISAPDSAPFSHVNESFTTQDKNHRLVTDFFTRIWVDCRSTFHSHLHPCWHTLCKHHFCRCSTRHNQITGKLTPLL